MKELVKNKRRLFEKYYQNKSEDKRKEYRSRKQESKEE